MGIEEIVDGKVETPEVVEAPQPEAPAEAIEPAAEPAPVPPAPAEPERVEHTIPLPVALGWRDELKDLKRWKQEQEAKAPAPKVPDPLDDPQGYDAHVEQLVNRGVSANKFEMSDVIAKQTHGKEAVDAAIKWAEERAAKGDRTFIDTYMANAHPIDWIVRQHKRDGLVSQLPEDVSSMDELIEREIAKRGLIAAAAPAAVEQQPAPATPPRSLASQPSQGGVKDVPTGPMAGLSALEAIINR